VVRFVLVKVTSVLQSHLTAQTCTADALDAAHARTSDTEANRAEHAHVVEL
jgi:hypothetical protein